MLAFSRTGQAFANIINGCWPGIYYWPLLPGANTFHNISSLFASASYSLPLFTPASIGPGPGFIKLLKNAKRKFQSPAPFTRRRRPGVTATIRLRRALARAGRSGRSGHRFGRIAAGHRAASPGRFGHRAGPGHPASGIRAHWAGHRRAPPGAPPRGPGQRLGIGPDRWRSLTGPPITTRLYAARGRFAAALPPHTSVR